jgi:ATP-dependent Clp protease protease subunit
MNVQLNGVVIDDDAQWLYDFFKIPAFSPQIVRQAVNDNPEREELVFQINSGGGGVFAGFEMYSVIRAAQCRTVAHVESLAASAASTVMCACDRVMLSPVAQVMIHLPTTYAEGNQDDFKHEAKVLDSVTQSILNAYELRCGECTTREHLSELMHAETWLSADEAIDLGLADGLLFYDDPNAVFSTNVVNCVGGGIRALAVPNAPLSTAALLQRYEAAVRAGAPPVEGHPVLPLEGEQDGEHEKQSSSDWRRQARLAIEQNRFF